MCEKQYARTTHFKQQMLNFFNSYKFIKNLTRCVTATAFPNKHLCHLHFHGLNPNVH